VDLDRIEPVLDLRSGRAKVRQPFAQLNSIVKRFAIEQQLKGCRPEKVEQRIRFGGGIPENRKPAFDQACEESDRGHQECCRE